MSTKRLTVIKRKALQFVILGFKVDEESIQLSHLQFADDVLFLFTQKSSFDNVKGLLSFKGISCFNIIRDKIPS